MIEEKLKEYIKEKYGSVSNFCKDIGMANSTFATIMTKGIQCANIKNIIKICSALEISADGLAVGKIVPLSNATPLREYAFKLASLPDEAKQSAMMYIDFLSTQSKEEEQLKRVVQYASNQNLKAVTEDVMQDWFTNGTPMEGIPESYPMRRKEKHD